MGLCHSSNSSITQICHPNENLDIYTVIWLDNRLSKFHNKNSIQKKLRRIINYVKIFEDDDVCEKFINQTSQDEHIVLIVNELIGQEFIPQIHDLQQIFSIYIYASTENTDQTWTHEYHKIKSACGKYEELIKIIEKDLLRSKYVPDKMLYEIFRIDKLDNSNDAFICSQVLIDVLLLMDPNFHDIRNFVSLCRHQYAGNKALSTILREFERYYTSDKAIWWLTRDTFIGRCLNKSLKTQNLNLLFLLRFFIHDIEQQLKQYHCVKPLQVYRYQLISIKELELLKASIGHYISINNFLLTMTNRNEALPSTNISISVDDLQPVLFEISTNCNLDSIRPFATVTSQSYFLHDCDQVLFMLGSIFQLQSIHQDDSDIWIIRIVLSSQANRHLKPIFEKYKNDHEDINLLSLGYILQSMNKLDEAKTYYNRLIDELPREDERLPSCLFSLGTIDFLRHDTNASLEWLFKSLDTASRVLQSNDLFLGSIYYSMGHVYKAKNDLLLALDSYHNAIMIWKQAIDDHYFNIAECMNAIGIIYRQRENYPLALEYFKKTLTILGKYLTDNDFDISKAHCNVASIHRQLGYYDLALEHYNLAFKILVKYFPLDHPNIAKALGNIGIVYALRGESSIAMLYYEKAAEIYRNKLPATHINNIKIKQLIRNVQAPHRRVSFGIIESR